MGCEESCLYEVVAVLAEQGSVIELHTKIMMWSNFCYFVVFLCFAALFFWRMIRRGGR